MTNFISKNHVLYILLLLGVFFNCLMDKVPINEQNTLKFKKIFFGTYAVEILYNENRNAESIDYNSLEYW